MCAISVNTTREWEQQRGGKEKRREKKRIQRKQKEKEETTATAKHSIQASKYALGYLSIGKWPVDLVICQIRRQTGSKWKIVSHHCDDRDIVKAEWGKTKKKKKKKKNKQHPKRRDEKTGPSLSAYISGESGCFSLKFQASEFIFREIVQAYPQHNSLIIPEMEELAGKNHCLVLPQMCTDGRVPGRRW